MATTVSRRNLILLSILAALVLTLAIGTFRVGRTRTVVGDPDSPAARIADSAVATFHDEFNHQRYETICQAADPDAFRSITALSCPEFLAYVRERLGSVQESKRSQLPVMEDASEDRPVRMGLKYATRFERDSGTEHFNWRVDAGKATLTSYSVSAEALSGGASNNARGTIGAK